MESFHSVLEICQPACHSLLTLLLVHRFDGTEFGDIDGFFKYIEASDFVSGLYCFKTGTLP